MNPTALGIVGILATVLIVAGIWLILNKDKHTSGINGRITGSGCPAAGPAPGPAPGPSSSCVTNYKFKIGEIIYSGSVDGVEYEDTVPIKYNPSDPYDNTIGVPKEDHRGIILIGVGIFMYIVLGVILFSKPI
jgi:hypothetical protein